MASDQSMTQAIIQTVIEAGKAATMLIRKAETPTNTTRPAPAQLVQC